MKDTLLASLERAISALNMVPSFKTPEGIRSYKLLSELDAVVKTAKAEKTATRYEARIVEGDDSFYVLLNEEGEAVEGTDFDAVKTEAVETVTERGFPTTGLVIAKIEVSYSPV